jgi:hypothetical protein
MTMAMAAAIIALAAAPVAAIKPSAKPPREATHLWPQK